MPQKHPVCPTCLRRDSVHRIPRRGLAAAAAKLIRKYPWFCEICYQRFWGVREYHRSSTVNS